MKTVIAIFGAGKCGELLFNNLKRNKRYYIECFIDDNVKIKKLKGLKIKDRN